MLIKKYIILSLLFILNFGCQLEDGLDPFGLEGGIEGGVMDEVELQWTLEQELSEEEGVVMNVWGTSDQIGWDQTHVWSVGGQPDQGKMWTWSQSQWD
jgi:hypothetical protein